MSKYIEFHPCAPKPRTLVWSVDSVSSGERLGFVKWYAPWRQYCFCIPMPDGSELVFSVGCMKDINSFIEEHKKDRVEPPTELDVIMDDMRKKWLPLIMTTPKFGETKK